MNERALTNLINDYGYGNNKYFILNDDNVLWLYYPKKEIAPQEVIEMSINTYYVDKYLVFEIPRQKDEYYNVIMECYNIFSNDMRYIILYQIYFL